MKRFLSISGALAILATALCGLASFSGCARDGSGLPMEPRSPEVTYTVPGEDRIFPACMEGGGHPEASFGLITFDKDVEVTALRAEIEYQGDGPGHRFETAAMGLKLPGTEEVLWGGGSCPVLPDPPGVTGYRDVDFGGIDLLPAGTYEVVIRHGSEFTCLTPPPGEPPGPQDIGIRAVRVVFTTPGCDECP